MTTRIQSTPTKKENYNIELVVQAVVQKLVTLPTPPIPLIQPTSH